MRLLTILIFVSTIAQTQVSLHEVVTINEDILFDELGRTPDWIEVANLGADTLNIEGFGLSDSRDELFKWKFPSNTILLPKSALVILANGANESVQLNCNFELSRRGETVYLTDPSGSITDSLALPRLAEDQGYGRLVDSTGFYYFKNVSPNSINTISQVDPVSSVRIATLPFAYKAGDSIHIEGTKFCNEILYSIDGSPPNIPVLNPDHIVLPEKGKMNPYFSLIPTRREYKLPVKVPQFPYLRVRCNDASLKEYSEDAVGLADRDQLITRHDLPVLKLEVDEVDFFGYKEGIYVEGEDFNYEKNGKAWRRDLEWTYVFDDETITGKAKAEIHGNATRALPQKSLKLTRIRQDADSTIGWPLLYDNEIFPFTEVVIRSMHSEFTGNEFTDYGFRDDLIMSIIQNEMEVYTQDARLVSVYLNGEYWGVHSLRESSEHDHIARETGLSLDQIIIEKGAAHVFDLYQRIEDLDPDLPRSYQRLSELFDMTNLIDYVLAETWFNNLDWPFNNIKTWREKGSEGPYRFILFDMDACLKFPRLSPFERFFPGNIPSRNNPDHFLFFEKLLSFPEFRTKLQERYNDLVKTVFFPESMIEQLEALSVEIEDELPMHISRWHYPRDVQTWKESRDDIRHFLLTRRLYFDDAILNLDPGMVYPNPTAHQIYVDHLPSNLQHYRWTTTLGHVLTSWLDLGDKVIEIPDVANNGSLIILECKGDHVYRSYPVLIQR